MVTCRFLAVGPSLTNRSWQVDIQDLGKSSGLASIDSFEYVAKLVGRRWVPARAEGMERIAVPPCTRCVEESGVVDA